MNPFFKGISELLKDKQEVKLNVQKVGEDLVVLTSIEIGGEEKHISMTGTPEELDQFYLTELGKPLSVESKFQSNADEVAEEVKEDLDEDTKTKKNDKKKAVSSKASKVKSSKGKPVKETLTKEEETKSEDDINTTGIAETVEITAVEEKAETVIEETVSAPEPVIEQVKEGPSPEEQFDFFMKEGKEHFDNREYESAEQSYSNAVSIFPDHAKAKAAYENAKRWAKAIADMRKLEEEKKAIEAL